MFSTSFIQQWKLKCVHFRISFFIKAQILHTALDGVRNGIIIMTWTFPCFVHSYRNTAFSQSKLTFSKCYFRKQIVISNYSFYTVYIYIYIYIYIYMIKYVSWQGPCLEYLLQHKILETLHTLGRADVSYSFHLSFNKLYFKMFSGNLPWLPVILF